ncbi:MAG: hypothetical protein AB7S57_23020 [Acetobacteraceae bacterium]
MKPFKFDSPLIRRLVIGICLGAAACTVQLTAPYSEEIDKDATALQSDFLKFAANMQMQAGKPEAYYTNHQQTYADFEARLAVMRMRSESLSSGVPCRRALDTRNSAERSLIGPMQSQVSEKIGEPGWGDSSCVTILVMIAGDQMERLRSQHEIRCNPSAKKELCTTLFSSPPIFGIFGTGQNNAPLVSAVAISLNELVGAERDIRPVQKN